MKRGGEGVDEGVEDDEEEDEGEGGKEGEEEDVASSSFGDDYKPFILPKIWSVNDFLSKIFDNVLGRLRP